MSYHSHELEHVYDVHFENDVEIEIRNEHDVNDFVENVNDEHFMKI